MGEKKIASILAITMFFGIAIGSALVWTFGSSGSTEFYYLTSKEPVGHDNLLVFSARVNNISNSINRFIQGEKWDIPPIKLSDSKLSYKDERRHWLVVNDDYVVFILYEDVSSVLTTEEVVASIFHEIGHVKLGHDVGNPAKKRNIQEEIDADSFAISAGVDPKYISSAIKKLFTEDCEEKQLRLEATEALKQKRT